MEEKKMETSVVIEQPIFSVETPYDRKLEIYADDLYDAEIGKAWAIQNQDRYPNRTCTWEESFEIVYKNELGVAVLYRSEEAEAFDYHKDEVIELIWVRLHERTKKETEE